MERHSESSCFRKIGSLSEMRVFQALNEESSSPLIVRYFGYDPETSEIHTEHMMNGSAFEYLQANPTPLSVRLVWALDICRALSFIHSKKVVWNDLHTGNVLVSDDTQHVLMCDFGQALFDPSLLWDSRSQATPPPQYVIPDARARNAYDRDIFSYGVLLFLLAANHYPHSPIPNDINIPEEMYIFLCHQRGEFDKLKAPCCELFSPIVDSCFRLKFVSSHELCRHMEEACKQWQALYGVEASGQ
jgi:serine/threonine protein kinase